MWNGRGGVWAMHPLDSERADTAWTPQRRLCDGFMKNKPIVAADVRAGRLVNPTSRLGDIITAAPAW